MAAIQFTGEQVAGRDILDVCDFDNTKQYVLTITECGKWKVEDISSFFSKIPGYNETVSQSLEHDTNGDLIRA